MTLKSGNGQNGLDDTVGGEKAAIAAALSVHYIALVLYALPALGSIFGIILLISGSIHDNAAAWLVIYLITLTFFVSHILAVRGLRKRNKWGYNASIALGVILLLLFPFGTVLGVILLSQLRKFRI